MAPLPSHGPGPAALVRQAAHLNRLPSGNGCPTAKQCPADRLKTLIEGKDRTWEHLTS